MIAAPIFTGPDDRAVHSIADTKAEAEASAWTFRKRGGRWVERCRIVLFVVVEIRGEA